MYLDITSRGKRVGEPDYREWCGGGGLNAILRYCNIAMRVRSMKINNKLWWGSKKHSDWDELAWELSDFPLGPDHIAR